MLGYIGPVDSSGIAMFHSTSYEISVKILIYCLCGNACTYNQFKHNNLTFFNTFICQITT
jgi:hypothetical protein